jgi:hypothetical protein
MGHTFWVGSDENLEFKIILEPGNNSEKFFEQINGIRRDSNDNLRIIDILCIILQLEKVSSQIYVNSFLFKFILLVTKFFGAFIEINDGFIEYNVI